MDLSLTRARGSSSQEAGSFHILGVTFHNVMGIPPEQGFRHKGWFGVEGYSFSARKGVLTKETGGEWPRLVKAASMEAYDPRQAVSCPHVPVPLCEANVEMALTRLPVAAI